MDPDCQMLFGRLEVFTLLVLFTPTFCVNDGVIRENINSFLNKGRTTREIASYLASELKELGIQADSPMCTALKNHNGKTMTVWLLCFYSLWSLPLCVPGICQKASTRLNSMPSAFYSVNLVARKRRSVLHRPTATRGSF